MVHVKLSQEEAEALLEGGSITIESANLGPAGRNGKVTLEVDEEGKDQPGQAAHSVRTGPDQRRF